MQSLFLPLSILSLPLSPYLLLCTICIVLCVQSEGVLSVLDCEAGKLWLCVCVCHIFVYVFPAITVTLSSLPDMMDGEGAIKQRPARDAWHPTAGTE